jgi:hypothetical protein
VSVVTTPKLLILKGGSSSVVERQLPKLNVAGSIPVSRSKQISNIAPRSLQSLVQIWSGS